MILLFRLSDGKIFAEMDGSLIMTICIGAVAAFCVKLLLSLLTEQRKNDLYRLVKILIL